MRRSCDASTKLVTNCRCHCLTLAVHGFWLVCCSRDQRRQPINPLLDTRYTLINGKLIIHEPQDTVDNGDYQCVARNLYGSVLSNSVTLAFGCECDLRCGAMMLCGVVSRCQQLRLSESFSERLPQHAANLKQWLVMHTQTC